VCDLVDLKGVEPGGHRRYTVFFLPDQLRYSHSNCAGMLVHAIYHLTGGKWRALGAGSRRVKHRPLVVVTTEFKAQRSRETAVGVTNRHCLNGSKLVGYLSV
jgi:hypothetical protein